MNNVTAQQPAHETQVTDLIAEVRALAGALQTAPRSEALAASMDALAARLNTFELFGSLCYEQGRHDAATSNGDVTTISDDPPGRLNDTAVLVEIAYGRGFETGIRLGNAS